MSRNFLSFLFFHGLLIQRQSVQELAIVHALKKVNVIISVRWVHILILDSLEIQCFGTTGVRMDFFLIQLSNLNHFKLVFKYLKLYGCHT